VRMLGEGVHKMYAALVNKQAPSSWILSDALEIWRLRLRSTYIRWIWL